MSLELDDSYFADEIGDDTYRPSESQETDCRPLSATRSSTMSIVASATTAVSKVPAESRMHVERTAGSPAELDTKCTSDDCSARKVVAHSLGQSRALPVVSNINQILATEQTVSEIQVDEQDEDEFSYLGPDQLHELTPEQQMKFFLSREKHFLVFSSAGKPIYSRYGTEQVISGYTGILQAIMGFYQDSDVPDTLLSFGAACVQATFLVKGPIYLVALSKHNEREDFQRYQLEFLYLVIVSLVTSTGMSRLVDRGSNFDLRRLLIGSEKYLDRICDAITFGELHLGLLLNALSVFRLKSTIRTKINNIMATKRPKTDSLLYGIIAIDKRMVNVIRPKGHSLYPSDLRLLFETVFSKAFEEGQDFWLPLCLPSFNSTGYLHVYVSFFSSGIAIILLSTDKDAFFEMQEMKERILKKFEKENLVRDLIRAKHTQVSTKLLCLDKIVEHFVFKSRSRVQYLAPDIHHDPQAGFNSVKLTQRQLMKIYSKLSSIDQSRNRFQIFRTSAWICATDGKRAAEILALSWATKDFELYVVSCPSGIVTQEAISVASLIGAANLIHQFVRREEGRIWVDDGVTF